MTGGIRVRPAIEKDAKLLWEWRNDPFVRDNSFKTEPIEWSDHLSWLAQRLRSSETRIYVLEWDDVPVGQVRYERRSSTMAEVGDISVTEVQRGRGLGKTLLGLTLEKACADLAVYKIEAIVKAGNRVSMRMFRSAGFDLDRQVRVNGLQCHAFLYANPGLRKSP